MGGHCISDDEPGEWAQLEWANPGASGFAAMLLAIGALVFLYWGIWPSPPVASGHSSPFDYLDMLRIGWFGWGDILMAGLLGWWASLLGRRATDPVAMTVDSKGLRLHPTLGGGLVPWSGIQFVRLWLGDGWPGIELGFVEPRRLGVSLRDVSHIVAGLDLDAGLAEDFVATAERLQQAAEAEGGSV